MNKHTVAIMGLGVRGKTHLKALLENKDRYEVVGICDIRPEVMDEVSKKFGLNVPKFTDVEEMLSKTKPEVFVFVTYPNLRLSMIELAVKHGIKAVSFEKPMAEDMAEAKKMTELCVANGIKAVVCHQQKYLKQMQELKRKVDRGDLGEVKKIFAECQPWMAQLGTHYMDYIIWANGGCRAKSAPRPFGMIIPRRTSSLARSSLKTAPEAIWSAATSRSSTTPTCTGILTTG